MGVLVAVLVGGAVCVIVAVGSRVSVGVIVGGSPVRSNLPEAFQPVPIKICTS